MGVGWRSFWIKSETENVPLGDLTVMFLESGLPVAFSMCKITKPAIEHCGCNFWVVTRGSKIFPWGLQAQEGAHGKTRCGAEGTGDSVRTEMRQSQEGSQDPDQV